MTILDNSLPKDVVYLSFIFRDSLLLHLILVTDFIDSKGSISYSTFILVKRIKTQSKFKNSYTRSE